MQTGVTRQTGHPAHEIPGWEASKTVLVAEALISFTTQRVSDASGRGTRGSCLARHDGCYASGGRAAIAEPTCRRRYAASALSSPLSDPCKTRGHSMSQLTELLGRLQSGDPEARAALFAAAYTELHRLARSRLRDGGRSVVLDTSCLVHEAYLRFASAGELRAEDRRAFFAYASQVMRSVILNSVHERMAQKRGGDWQPLTLSTQLAADVADDQETILKVHEAMEALERAEPRLAQVAQMRYFGGYSEQEIAETLGITERTVRRDWEKARLILAELVG